MNFKSVRRAIINNGCKTHNKDLNKFSLDKKSKSRQLRAGEVIMIFYQQFLLRLWICPYVFKMVATLQASHPHSKKEKERVV